MRTENKLVVIWLGLVLLLLLTILFAGCAVVTINTGEDVTLDEDTKKKPPHKKVQGLVKKLIK